MSRERPDYEFEGFEAPRYTPTPDQLFDELLAPGLLTEAELRVLLYIVRRTFGWKKDSDTISLAQITDGIFRRDGERLDWGAGVAKSSAVRAVKGLAEKGIILATRNQSAERGFEATTYALRLRQPLSQHESKVVTPLSHGETSPPRPLSQHETRASITVKQALVSPRNIQERSFQETKKQEESNLTDAGATETTRYSPWIAGIIDDYSNELGEPQSTAINISRALRLWHSSGLAEIEFVEKLRQARDLTRRAQGAQGTGTIGRKMAYFFTVVADQTSVEQS